MFSSIKQYMLIMLCHEEDSLLVDRFYEREYYILCAALESA